MKDEGKFGIRNSEEGEREVENYELRIMNEGKFRIQGNGG